jgi:hypothetical protein
MPFSITPVPFEWFPEGACTRPFSFRADAIRAVLLVDSKLPRKSESVLPRSRGNLDPPMTADSRLRISGSALASVGAVEANYFGAKSCRLHARGLFHRLGRPCFSIGEDRLSLRKRDVRDYRFDSADKSCVDRCPTSIH